MQRETIDSEAEAELVLETPPTLTPTPTPGAPAADRGITRSFVGLLSGSYTPPQLKQTSRLAKLLILHFLHIQSPVRILSFPPVAVVVVTLLLGGFEAEGGAVFVELVPSFFKSFVSSSPPLPPTLLTISLTLFGSRGLMYFFM